MKKLLILFFGLFACWSLSAQTTRGTSMTMPPSGPNINVSGIPLQPFTTTAGSASASQFFNFSATGLTASVVWAPDAPMEVSTNNITFNSTSVTFTQSGGNASGIVYVRIKASATNGSYSPFIRATSAGSNNPAVACIANVGSNPSMSVNTNTITNLNGAPPAAGTPQTFIVTFANITGNVLVQGFTQIELSQDNITYNPNISFSTGSPVTVYSRATSSAPAGSYADTIRVSATGVTTQKIATSGTIASSGGTNDTVQVYLQDSIRGGPIYSNNAWNKWSPVGPSTGLTSAPLKYATGVQSPIQVTINTINDYTQNGATYGTSNTTSFPQPVFQQALYTTSSPTTLQFRALTAGTYKFDLLGSTNQGTGPFNVTITSGSATDNLNCYSTATAGVARMMTLDNLVLSTGVSTLVITFTPANSFTVINGFRLIKKN